MIAPHHTPKPQMTRAGNETAAVMKVTTAPLATLTRDMLESIAASHARRGSRQWGDLLTRLQRIVGDRQRREGGA